MQQIIRKIMQESLDVKMRSLNNTELIDLVENAVDLLAAAVSAGGKILFCGNGGSAADAQHLAAELSGRYYYDRPPIYAEALHVNSSFVTAVANDFSYEKVFSRMVEAAGKEGDVLVALSTSGKSPGIIAAIQTARNRKMKVIGLTGQSGGDMNQICDILLRVPSDDTPRIQEVHILLGHIICELLEKKIFPQPQ
jgi:D-sedoheptulose 7-phosphate isomerase